MQDTEHVKVGTMKAADITQPGLYWYKNGDEWTAIEATHDFHKTKVVFWFIGREDESELSEMTGEFIGPIEPPQ